MPAADAYRTLYARAPIPMVTVRDDGQVVDANDAFCEAAHTSRDRLVGAAFVDPLAAQDRGASRVYLRRALDRGDAEWAVTLTGAPDVRWRVRGVSFLGRVVVLMLWTPPDRDVARTLVPALAALVRRVPEQSVVLLSPDLWVLGAWGMAEVAGVDDSEIVGRHLRRVVDAEPALLEELAGALESEESWDGVLALSDEVGGGGACRGDLVPARVVGGSRQGAGFLVLRSVSGEAASPARDRRRLHRLARVGDFSVELADALAQRVRALVRSDPRSPEAERLRLEFEALDHRLRQFTDVARIDGRIGVSEAAEGLRDRWKTFLREQGIELAVVVDDAPGPALGVSEDLVATILDELVENARVAVSDADERRIVVTFGRDDGRARVTVADTGPGVPGSRREAVFRPFVSGWPGRLGLGLSTARTHLELVGGGVSIAESETGALVVALFPEEGSAAKPADVSDGLRSPILAGRTVLVVDESEEARRALARILGGVGMVVREAWSARSAVAELVQQGAVDAVVCTVGGDEAGGARFVSELREVGPALVERTTLLADVASARRKALEQRWGCAVLARPLVVQQLLDHLESLARTRS